MFKIHRTINPEPPKYGGQDISVPVEISPEMKVILELFKPNEDGVITGDLSLLTNQNASEAVKSFAERYLFQRIKTGQSFNDLSDDDKLALIPSCYETFENYTARVRRYIEDNTPKSDE